MIMFSLQMIINSYQNKSHLMICILGTEKLLRDTRNFDTSYFEIKGVNYKLKSTEFKM